MSKRKPGNPGKQWRAGQHTRNAVKNDGAVAHVALTNVAGEVVAWTKIDSSDVDHVLSRRWCLRGSPDYAISPGSRVEAKAAGVPRRPVYLHRFIMDEPAGMEIDHINGDRLDNRRLNLRVVTRRENSQNVVKSAHRNVYQDRRNREGGWFVNMTVDGVRHRSVYLTTRDEALFVAKQMRAALMSHANEDRHAADSQGQGL